jgi:xylulose-5-phosphate/fructose-6-phosphate phosphoketolase
LLRRTLPELAVRVVNVVYIARLMTSDEHPYGMGDFEYDGLFTADKPVIFAHHGCPWLIDLVMAVVDRVPGLAVRVAAGRQRMEDARLRHHDWIRIHGTELPEVAEWAWDG